MQNQKNEKITIKAELPVPLGELVIYVVPKNYETSSIVELLNQKPLIANLIIEKIARGIIRKKKLELKLEKLEFDYYDSPKIDFGVAYFKAELKGAEKSLKKIAGENKVFFFDWETYKKEKSNETLSANTK